MPEGDTIAYAAKRMRPVLEGHVPDEIRTPQPRHALHRWPERLAGRAVTQIRTHGKHLFIRFDGGLTLHSHLRMTGTWGVYAPDRRWGRSPRLAWLVLERGGHQVVQFNGPVLELLTDSRAGLRPASRPGSSDWAGPASSGCFDQRLAALGPDILAAEFDVRRFLGRLRADDPTRSIGDALLDQRTVAGIGNIWKAEGCWEAGIDPWRPLAEVSDAEAVAIVTAVRPRMRQSAEHGRMDRRARVYRRQGRPCPRCGTPVRARAGGPGRAASASDCAGPAATRSADEGNRITFWCPGCQR